MKRDFELIRKLLFQIEEGAYGKRIPSGAANYSGDIVEAHLGILISAGYATWGDIAPQDGPLLRWSGRDALDVIRDQECWQMIVDHFATRGLWIGPWSVIEKMGERYVEANTGHRSIH